MALTMAVPPLSERTRACLRDALIWGYWAVFCAKHRVEADGAGKPRHFAAL
jgi:hypothetical protein